MPLLVTAVAPEARLIPLSLPLHWLSWLFWAGWRRGQAEQASRWVPCASRFGVHYRPFCFSRPAARRRNLTGPAFAYTKTLRQPRQTAFTPFVRLEQLSTQII